MKTSRNHSVMYGVATTILILATCGVTRAVEFAGGTGEPNDPYQIATADQLAGIGDDEELLSKHYVLINDIDLDPNLPGERVFSESLIAPEIQNLHGMILGYFQGSFNGGGHVIRNLTIHSETRAAAGLFGYMDASAQIENLGLADVEIRRSGAGTQDFTVGGLVAVNDGGAILGCYVTGHVGDIGAYCAGGLVGENHGLVHACYTIAQVQGNGIVGGLVGLNDGDVRFCFAAGAPYGSGRVGGLAGRNDDGGTVRHSYWNADAGSVTDREPGTAKTSAELMSRETYEPWIYTGAWVLDDGNDYPHLLWEGAAGTMIGTVLPGYAGGSGDPNDPYRIETPEQFIAIAYRPADFDKSFVLTTDLDFNDVDSNDVLPIGLESLAFSGEFDGGSHSLSNLAILRPDANCVGVFGVVGPSNVFPQGQTIDYQIGDNDDFGWGYGQRGSRIDQSAVPRTTVLIRHLYIRNVEVVGRQYVGGLIGLGQATLEDCSITGEVTGQSLVGGLVGRAVRGALSRCSADAHVTGKFAVGGVIGSTWPGYGLTVEDCLAAGIVTGQLCAGGLIGCSESGEDSVKRCSATCDVHGRYITGGCLGSTIGSAIAMSCARGGVAGESWMGGFAGQILHAEINDSYCVSDVSGGRNVGGFVSLCRDESIMRCYAASSVTASDADPDHPWVGGFVGYAGPSDSQQTDACMVEAENCFWDAELSGPVTAAGGCPISTPFIRGLATAQMQTASPFVAAGWDFENDWTICEGWNYPRLQWEMTPCEGGL
ncbi:MAG: hypothetical protein ACM3VT_14035 [Solirubrobacterales bacterium]